MSHFMSCLKFKLMTAAVLTGLMIESPTSQAQQEIPALAIAPWETAGVEREIVKASEGSLLAAQKAIAEKFVQEVQPLSPAAMRASTPLNLQRTAARILSGPAKRPLTLKAVAIEPLWYALADFYVVALAGVDGNLNTLLAAPHRAIKKSEWLAALAQNTLTGMLTKITEELSEELAKRLNSPPPKIRDALHVAIAAATETQKLSEGAHACLNLLLADQLAMRSFTVVFSPGSESLASMRLALGAQTQPRRATRTIVTRWAKQETPQQAPSRSKKLVPPPAPTLPLTFDLTATVSETVMGQPLGRPPEDSLGLAVSPYLIELSPNQTLTLAPDAQLLRFLDGERQALSLNDPPQVAKVRGAWVYLDKGRAYGLNMDDRLITQGDGGAPIKGHVVGYFGPELNLKSPRGFAIHEGAIVYVRKGQRDTKIGQAFIFDPQTYPY